MKVNGHCGQLDRLNIEVGPGQRAGGWWSPRSAAANIATASIPTMHSSGGKCREDIVGEFELPEDAHEFVECTTAREGRRC